MSKIMYSACIMILLGILSSVVGSILPYFVKIKGEKKITFLYQLVSGIMVGIVCISMIPESLDISGMFVTILGIIIGTLIVLLIDIFITKINTNTTLNKLILIISSMSLHNIIEGIAVGASLEHSFSLGISIFLAMFLHDIPEGMIVGVANLDNRKSLKKVTINSLIVGIFSGIGIIIGMFFGSISDFYTSMSLSISGGAMLYIVTKTLVTEENTNEKSYIISLSFILGILISTIITIL